MNHHQHTENMPRWARRLEECGRKDRKEKQERSRTGEYIANIIFNLVFLWIVNKIPAWHLSFIRDNYMVVLWILNVNILVQIAGNALMLVAGIPAIRYLARIVTEASSFVTLIVLFYIYPFDFTNVGGGAWLDWFLPIALIIGMVVSAMKVVGNLWKLVFWR
jgi:hypothetical protein